MKYTTDCSKRITVNNSY